IIAYLISQLHPAYIALHLFSIFSFSHYRYPHFFPTRRSSDLIPPQPPWPPPCRPRARSKGASSVRPTRPGAPPPHPRAPPGARPDRKSTRLNSSPVSNSYTVFCSENKKLVKLCKTNTMKRHSQ